MTPRRDDEQWKSSKHGFFSELVLNAEAEPMFLFEALQWHNIRNYKQGDFSCFGDLMKLPFFNLLITQRVCRGDSTTKGDVDCVVHLTAFSLPPARVTWTVLVVLLRWVKPGFLHFLVHLLAESEPWVILRLFLFFPDLSLVILIKSILIKKKKNV